MHATSMNPSLRTFTKGVMFFRSMPAPGFVALPVALTFLNTFAAISVMAKGTFLKQSCLYTCIGTDSIISCLFTWGERACSAFFVLGGYPVKPYTTLDARANTMATATML